MARNAASRAQVWNNFSGWKVNMFWVCANATRRQPKPASRGQERGLVFKALADGTRRRILDLLRKQPRTTGELCAHFGGVDRCTVMKHLGVLGRAGLIGFKREGNFRWNYLDPFPLMEIYEKWMGQYARREALQMKHDLGELRPRPVARQPARTRPAQRTT